MAGAMKKELRQERVNDGDMIVKAVQHGAGVGEGKPHETLEIFPEILLCQDEAVRAPRVAQAHHVSEPDKEQEQHAAAGIPRGDRDSLHGAAESAGAMKYRMGGCAPGDRRLCPACPGARGKEPDSGG